MDKREDVLVRLLAICRTVVGVQVVERNKDIASDWNLPAIALWDGDEDAAEDSDPGHPPRTPAPVTMVPEPFVRLGNTPDGVGTELNRMRARILKAILTDAELKTIVGTHGQIRYEACAPSLARGRKILGEMGLVFRIVYVLKASEL